MDNKSKSWFDFPYTVSMRDTDATGFVFHARYLEILTTARERLAERIGLDFETLKLKYDAMLVVRNIKVDYYKPAYLQSRIIVKTRVEKAFNAKITVAQKIYLIEDLKKPILEALMQYAYIDVNELSPKLIPLEIFKQLDYS